MRTDSTTAVQSIIQNMETNGKIKEIITKNVESTIQNLIEDTFKSYGDLGACNFNTDAKIYQMYAAGTIIAALDADLNYFDLNLELTHD